MTTVTKADIIKGLRDLGLFPGSKVLVHSSLSSFGQVEGGVETVIDALLATVDEQGTVLVPTLTGSELLSPENPPVFDPANTPCWVGRIPETFRQRPEAIRSINPTHSVAAIGADADLLTRFHRYSITPGDEQSPYLRLAGLPDGYVLLLGVGHESNTTFHSAEELVGVDYHMMPGLVPAKVLLDGVEQTLHVMLHQYGTPRNFPIMESIFIERGIQRTGKIGDATVRLMRSGPMVDAIVRALRADPTILIAKDA